MSVSQGLYEVVDLLIYNLMGHFGVTRAALWLAGNETKSGMILIRSRGFNRDAMVAIGSAFGAALARQFSDQHGPSLLSEVIGDVSDPTIGLLRLSGAGLLAPITARRELLGWVALGERLDHEPYTKQDLQALEASLALAGAAIQNCQLFGEVIATNGRLQASNDRLSEADRLKDEFISNLNHELRTPLTAVLGALQCLQIIFKDNSDAHGLVQTASGQAHHLVKLVENLLTFSDVSRGQLRFSPKRSVLQATIQPWFEKRMAGVAARLREFSMNCSPNLPEAVFDPERLVQVLDELLENAVKFTKEGCKVQIQATKHAQDGRSWVRVSVVDDGPGIPPHRLDSLFRAFEQVDGSMTRRVGGLGLGLSSAVHLAEGMGGRLQAENLPGAGARFSILLPLA
jgi:signal transduction histidine kinase